MKKYIIFSLIIFSVSVSALAQINFEEAYVIFNDGTKKTCLIKNEGWEFNPSEIEVKFDDSEEIQTLAINQIKGFGFYYKEKYERNIVKIDQSSNNSNIKPFSKQRAPEFVTDTVFLKILVEGDVNLYYYAEKFLSRFFFKTGNSDPVPLIYKKYYVNLSEFSTNKSYIQQLYTLMADGPVSESIIKKTEYNLQDMISLFSQFNGLEEKEEKSDPNQKVINIGIKGSVHHTSLKIYNSVANYREVDYGSYFQFRPGVNTELFLPFRKNKWKISVGLSYYKQAKSIQVLYDFEVIPKEARLSYQGIEVPLNLYYQFYLENDSYIFVNGGLLFDIAINSSHHYLSTIPIAKSINYNAGIGYSYRNLIALSLDYFPYRDMFPTYNYYTNYNSYGISLQYNFYRK